MTATAPVAPPPPVAPAPKKGGCWKWAAIGCLLMLVLGLVSLGGIAMIVFGAIKSTDAYKTAVTAAEKDPRVIEALGAPMHPGFLATGNVDIKNERGTANVEFPLIGSKSRGDVHVVATLDSSGWHYIEMTVTPRNGPSIDLLGR